MKLIVLALAVGCVASQGLADSPGAVSRFRNPPGKYALQGENDINKCGCSEIVAKLKKVESNLLQLILNLRNKYSHMYSELIDLKKQVNSLSWYADQTAKTGLSVTQQLQASSSLLAHSMRSIRYECSLGVY
uniref:Uncharacterized protein n=1 Tax=Anopheles culicifacies TaxID=139723 RepID=A0A182MNH3_9DIPT